MDINRISAETLEAAVPEMRSIDATRTLRPGATAPRECRMHGDFMATLERRVFPRGAPNWWTQCPRCETEMEADAADVHSSATARDNHHGGEQRAGQQLVSAGVPELFKGASIWNFATPLATMVRVKNRVAQWAKQFHHHVEVGHNIVLAGAVGTGKTHLAVGLMREVHKSGGTTRYMSESEVIELIQSTYGGKGSPSSVIEALTKPDLLVIDEVGRSNDSQDSVRIMGDVINARYGKQRPTCIVTNANRDTLTKHVGENTASRLLSSTTTMIGFKWPDARTTGLLTETDE